MNKLVVRFDNPENGWIGIILKSDSEEFSLNISYTPYNFVEELTEAIIKVLGNENAKANGSYNPERYEFRFEITDEQTCLKIFSFPDYRTNENLGELLFQFGGNKIEICKAFWRGLKDLEGKCSSEEFEKSFHRKFPAKDLNYLSERIRKF